MLPFLDRSADSFRRGQSLVELLVAIGVGVIFVVGALSVFAPAVRSHGDALKIQAASALSKELLDNVRNFGEANWHNLDNLSTTTANKYYLIASTSPFTFATGTENVLVGTTTYTRYFYLDNVNRNAGGKIDEAATTYDPSVKKITVVAGWGNGTSSVVSYLARTNDYVFTQTDWSQGAGQDGPLTATGTNAKFSTSSNIDYTTSTGSLVISGF